MDAHGHGQPRDTVGIPGVGFLNACAGYTVFDGDGDTVESRAHISQGGVPLVIDR